MTTEQGISVEQALNLLVESYDIPEDRKAQTKARLRGVLATTRYPWREPKTMAQMLRTHLAFIGQLVITLAICAIMFYFAYVVQPRCRNAGGTPVLALYPPIVCVQGFDPRVRLGQ